MIGCILLHETGIEIDVSILPRAPHCRRSLRFSPFCPHCFPAAGSGPAASAHPRRTSLVLPLSGKPFPVHPPSFSTKSGSLAGAVSPHTCVGLPSEAFLFHACECAEGRAGWSAPPSRRSTKGRRALGRIPPLRSQTVHVSPDGFHVLLPDVRGRRRHLPARFMAGAVWCLFPGALMPGSS